MVNPSGKELTKKKMDNSQTLLFLFFVFNHFNLFPQFHFFLSRYCYKVIPAESSDKSSSEP